MTSPPGQAAAPPPRFQLKINFSNGRPNPPFFLMHSVIATIGSSIKCDVWFKDPDVAPGAAMIQQMGDGFLIRNVGPKDSLILNGKPIHEAPLKGGADIQIGIYRMTTEVIPIPPNHVFQQANVQVGIDPPLPESQRGHRDPSQSAPRFSDMKGKLGDLFFRFTEGGVVRFLQAQLLTVAILLASGYVFFHHSLFQSVREAIGIEEQSKLAFQEIKSLFMWGRHPEIIDELTKGTHVMPTTGPFVVGTAPIVNATTAVTTVVGSLPQVAVTSSVTYIPQPAVTSKVSNVLPVPVTSVVTNPVTNTVTYLPQASATSVGYVTHGSIVTNAVNYVPQVTATSAVGYVSQVPITNTVTYLPQASATSTVNTISQVPVTNTVTYLPQVSATSTIGYVSPGVVTNTVTGGVVQVPANTTVVFSGASPTAVPTPAPIPAPPVTAIVGGRAMQFPLPFPSGAGVLKIGNAGSPVATPTTVVIGVPSPSVTSTIVTHSRLDALLAAPKTPAPTMIEMLQGHSDKTPCLDFMGYALSGDEKADSTGGVLEPKKHEAMVSTVVEKLRLDVESDFYSILSAPDNGALVSKVYRALSMREKFCSAVGEDTPRCTTFTAARLADLVLFEFGYKTAQSSFSGRSVEEAAVHEQLLLDSKLVKIIHDKAVDASRALGLTDEIANLKAQIIPALREIFTNFVKERTKLEAERKWMISKIESLEFDFSDCESPRGLISRLSSGRAAYFSETNSISYCPSKIMVNNSRFHVVYKLARLFARAIGPCYLSQTFRSARSIGVSPVQTSSFAEVTNECFRSPGSIWVALMNQKILSAKLSSGVDGERHDECLASNVYDSIFSDWAGTIALSSWLGSMMTKGVPPELKLGLRNVWRSRALLQNGDETVLPLYYRMDGLFAANPTIRAALGCPKDVPHPKFRHCN